MECAGDGPAVGGFRRGATDAARPTTSLPERAFTIRSVPGRAQVGAGAMVSAGETVWWPALWVLLGAAGFTLLYVLRSVATPKGKAPPLPDSSSEKLWRQTEDRMEQLRELE